MPQFSEDLDQVMGRAHDAGVGLIVNVGFDRESIEETLLLTDRYGGIYAAVGIHPHNSADWDDAVEGEIKKHVLRKKVLAVGEIGLDYYRDLSPRDIQEDVFRRQIGMALYFGVPMIIHCREAFEDVIRILNEEGAAEVGGIFHAFSGGMEEAADVLKLGFLIGIGGPITYKNSKLPDVVSRLPSNSILTETDCPYLPPEPYRGKRNEPAYVRIVAEKMADALSVEVTDVERAVEVNFKHVLLGETDFAPSVAYRLKGNVYLNVTSTCTNYCRFCPRLSERNYLYGYNLKLLRDPDVDEMVSGVRGLEDEAEYGELVFCGLGEPTTRLSDIIDAAGRLGSSGHQIRLNTNGHGNMINQRNIVPELERAFDRISISLNAHDRDSYIRFCRPDAGGRAFDSLMDFIGKAAASRMECTVTAVDYPGVDIEACRELVGSVPGAVFRVRRCHEGWGGS